VADGVVYVGSSDGNLYAVKASTGKIRWSFASGGQVLSSPVVNGMVYFGSGYPGLGDTNVYAFGLP
jgi:outer membrane protein assembly factor BamB